MRIDKIIMGKLFKRLIFLTIFYCGLICVDSANIYSSKKDKSILNKIAMCPETTSYWGIKEIEINRGEKRYYIKYETTHLAPDKLWIKYLKPERIEGREVIRTDMILCSKEKGDEKYSIGRQRLRLYDFKLTRENIELIMKNYDVIPQGKETVLGRDNKIFEVVSKNGKMPSVKVWMDDKTGLIIKYEKYFENKKLISYWFDEIKINPEIDTGIFSVEVKEKSKKEPPKSKEFSTLEAINEEINIPFVKSNEIAYGYVFSRGRMFLRKGVKTMHLLYNDGMNNISVFIEKLKNSEKIKYDEGEIKIKSSRGRTIISKVENNISVKLIGRLKEEDMMKIFFSLYEREK